MKSEAVILRWTDHTMAATIRRMC